MTLDQALQITKTKNKNQLCNWLGKQRSTAGKWNADEIPLSVERAIKDKLSAQKQERAEAKKLKGVHKID